MSARFTPLTLTCASILTLVPAGARGAAPPSESSPASASKAVKHARAQRISGGLLLGLGFAAELSGAIVSTRCQLGQPCAQGILLTLGEAEGPSHYTLISTGSSSSYVFGRLIAAPLLIGGATSLMVGLARTGAPPSSWSPTRRRKLGWSLVGAGLGVLVLSRIARFSFIVANVCQNVACTHGFDQTSLWVGRGLTFAGTGLLVQSPAKPVEIGVGAGPSRSYGLSIAGRF